MLDAAFFKRVLKFSTCLEMPVNITQFQVSVGIFNKRNFAFRPKFLNFIGHKCWSTNHLYFELYFTIFPMNLVLFLVFVIAVLSPKFSFYITSRNTYPSMLVITVCGLCVIYFCYVVMLNSIQDPIRILQKKVSICHWNLNGIAAHNFVKLVLLKAYDSIHQFNIICLSENSSIRYSAF